MKKISVETIQDIVATCPIGYYANCRIPISVAEEGGTYFRPSDRTIVVSAEMVNDALTNSAEKLEGTVRAFTYHEVSHAILTPFRLGMTDIINVFEDERIETLCKDFYEKVDFKDNIYRVSPPQSNRPQNSYSAFFWAVRFRIAPPDILDTINNLIRQYRKMNWNTNQEIANDYYNAIYTLYYRVDYDYRSWDYDTLLKDFRSKWFNEVGDFVHPMEYDEFDPYDDEDEKQNGGQEGEGGKAKSKSDGEIAEGSGMGAGEPTSILEQIEQSINIDGANIYNKTFYRDMESILCSFDKRNKQGSAMTAYSGRFNPRLANRTDYRFFERSSSVASSSNPYGTFTLNLFVDNSGSFDRNEETMRKILSAIYFLEKKFKKVFKCNVRYCGNGIKNGGEDVPYNCNCGTSLSAEDIEVVQKLQEKNTFVYNLVLYDGTAYGKGDTLPYVYYPFDLPNTTMILDDTCSDLASELKRAKYILVEGAKNTYCKNLEKNILKVLQMAFR